MELRVAAAAGGSLAAAAVVAAVVYFTYKLVYSRWLRRRQQRDFSNFEEISGVQRTSSVIVSEDPPSFKTEPQAVQPQRSLAGAEAAAAAAQQQQDEQQQQQQQQQLNLMSAEAYDEGADCGLGRLNFVVGYDWASRQLSVKVARAENLPSMDFPMGTSDPYCKVTILPDKGNKVRTQVKMRKLNPRWNEVFVFENFPGERLLNRTLLVRVLDYDRFSRDDPIGDVRFPLVFLYDERCRPRSLDVWRQLQPNKATRGYVGSVLAALSYNPQTSHLTLIALKAKDLKAMDLGRTSDPYCVVKLINNRTRKLVAKKKTMVAHRTLCPQWNEPFVFSVNADKIHEYHLELVVKDKDFIGSDTIGRIRLGTRSSAEEAKHWTEMTNRPRQQIARWHTLKH